MVEMNTRKDIMATYCLIGKCNWIDHVDNLFDHIEQEHREHIIAVNSNNMIEFSMNDFMIRSQNEKPLLLLTEFGMYWFLRVTKSSEEMLLGLYYIGDAENINYTIKFGQKSNGWLMYYGGVKAKSDTTVNECRNDIYPISYFQYDIDNMTENNVTTVKLVLHGEDEWKDTEEFPTVELNNKIIEKLLCVICFENLRYYKQGIFCDNQHIICDSCMKLYTETQAAFRCPCCNEIIRYESRNFVLEHLANVLKWPEETIDQNVTSLEDHDEVNMSGKLNDANVTPEFALQIPDMEVKIIKLTESV